MIDQEYQSKDILTNEPQPAVLTEEMVHKLVAENIEWATSIAKSVARAWNMDWQLDGLDGGAYEALVFCSKRYNPNFGVPFRAYARKRIHEASTEEARKSKHWQQRVSQKADGSTDALEISVKLFNIFPEMRDGLLPDSDHDGEDGLRSSVRQLLTGASLIAAFEESGKENPEKATEYKRLVDILTNMEIIHQKILWSVYWEGKSMRNLAQEWGVDELSIIREHKDILGYLCTVFQSPRHSPPSLRLKIRRGLKNIALSIRKDNLPSPFQEFLTTNKSLVIFSILNFCIFKILTIV